MSARYDVICIGSGAAGLAGAARAAQLGARVLVIEKAPRFGGTTATSYGALWAGANHVQRASQIDDSPEAALEYVRFLAGGFEDADRMERFVREAPSVLERIDAMGVTMREIEGVVDHHHPAAPGSHSRGRTLEVVPVERSLLGEMIVEPARELPPGVSWSDMVAWGGPASRHRWDGAELAERSRLYAAGQALVARLLLVCAGAGVELRASWAATRLLTDDDAVVGVRAEHQGEAEDLLASRGVLIATGTYFGNPLLVRALEDFAEIGNYFPEAITGDGLILGAEVGALVSKVPLHLVRSLGYFVPPEGDEPERFETVGVTQLPYPHCILVNRSGVRFADESMFQALVPKLHEFDMEHHRRANLPCFMVFDQTFVDRYGFAGRLPGEAAPGWLARAADPAELAAALGLPADALAATIERFNEGARGGIDPDFGRGSSEWARSSTGDAGQGGNANLGPLEEPPFYGVELAPGGAGASGLTADRDGRILHVRGHPIPGLYGAGIACTVNEYGAGYQAGHSLTSAMTFASLAVEHALSRSAA